MLLNITGKLFYSFNFALILSFFRKIIVITQRPCPKEISSPSIIIPLSPHLSHLQYFAIIALLTDLEHEIA